ncbi:hypothetical protein JR316_0006286 [Psilocybe cubensis]|uniref:Uncharacterized protein n=2 Tax=Psilocybe cubensis TaxID=181762 RepID=A0ACB8H3G1_PSICU|nr:hypothetical protein JR316_0006286 [Psilocybe cubensis]KAH9481759.1 hypothetical protein JR316_0006286 [Psilocybe cubensis]
MPGANYMGGKRNAMKARAKDTIGRQEKGHFGRQRLNILSQGLSASKPSEKAQQAKDIMHPNSKGLSDIDLAHARKKIPIDSDADTTKWFIPKPIHISPSTPRSRRYMRDRDAHTSSSRSNGGRSKILDALDTSQPIFLRRVMDDILAMDDLAGLSGIGPSSIRAETWNQDSDHSGLIEMADSDPRSKIDIEEVPSSRMRTPARSKASYIPSSITRRLMDDSRPSFESRLLGSSKNHHRRNSSALMPSMPVGKNSSSDFFDSQCSDFFHEEDKASNALAIRRQSSFATSEDADFIHPERASSYSPRCYSMSSHEVECEKQSQSSIETSDDPFEDIHNGLPSFIRLGPLRNRRGNTEICVYGSLFEQSDPWSTIGLILGLEGIQEDKLLVDEILEDDWGCESLFGGACQDDMSDENILDIPWEDLLPNTKPTSPMPALPSRHSPICDKETTVQLECNTPPLGPLCDRMHANENAAIEELVENIKNGDKIVLPELREVDGRFLGPSLFDDFDESE